MDTTFWQRQLDAFIAAPLPSLFFLALGAIGAWWLSSTTWKARLAAAHERVGVLQERLTLAAEQVQLAEKARQQLEADLAKIQQRDDTTALIDIRATRETADRTLSAFRYWTNNLKDVLMTPGSPQKLEMMPIVNKRPKIS
jgi:hypothetical protein